MHIYNSSVVRTLRPEDCWGRLVSQPKLKKKKNGVRPCLKGIRQRTMEKGSQCLSASTHEAAYILHSPVIVNEQKF